MNAQKCRPTTDDGDEWVTIIGVLAGPHSLRAYDPEELAEGCSPDLPRQLDPACISEEQRQEIEIGEGIVLCRLLGTTRR